MDQMKDILFTEACSILVKHRGEPDNITQEDYAQFAEVMAKSVDEHLDIGTKNVDKGIFVMYMEASLAIHNPDLTIDLLKHFICAMCQLAALNKAYKDLLAKQEQD